MSRAVHVRTKLNCKCYIHFTIAIPEHVNFIIHYNVMTL